MRSRQAQLIVRNLEAEVVTRLRRRAAEHQRSMEAEHRQILRDELLTGNRRRRSLKGHLLAMPDIGRDEDFARPPDRGRNVRL